MSNKQRVFKMESVDHEEKFLEYHKENPHVYELFKKYCTAAFESGRRHYSAYAIFERIRWHHDIETKCELGFKLNNNHRPYYARMYQMQFPNRAHFFRTRVVRGERQYDQMELV
jgi:hypothetical protein